MSRFTFVYHGRTLWPADFNRQIAPARLLLFPCPQVEREPSHSYSHTRRISTASGLADFGSVVFLVAPGRVRPHA
ncbi:MAG TPA: hypothetical protein VEP67_09765 [Thiobacillaceae bacterium]|nr:hypothetical protein [Thiobacillaceae bacterium]